MTQPFMPSLFMPGHKPTSRLHDLVDDEGNSFDQMVRHRPSHHCAPQVADPTPLLTPLPCVSLGQYTLHSKLGDGMTACVYVAYDKVTKRTCACKLAERKAQQPSWSRLVQVRPSAACSRPAPCA